jgi:pimeloyl-ACP methyl ester carboxylesterase
VNAPRGRAAVATLFVLLWAGNASAEAPRRHQVNVDGFPVTVWEKSARQPKSALLLVHGRTWSALPNFDLQVKAGTGPGHARSVMEGLAASGHAVYAIDLRGYGATPRDASGWLTPQRAADDVAAVLRWIAAQRPLPRPPSLLGYSRGAHVSLLVAQQHPETLSSLVLFALPPVGPVERAAPPAEPPRRPTTREAAAEDFITPGAAARDVIDAYVDQAVGANPVRMDWRDENQFVFDAGKVRNPTLILYGANDPLLNDASLAFFGALATRDRSFVVLPDSDHAAHVENSQPAWLRAVDAFVNLPRADAAAR